MLRISTKKKSITKVAISLLILHAYFASKAECNAIKSEIDYLMKQLKRLQTQFKKLEVIIYLLWTRAQCLATLRLFLLIKAGFCIF